MDFCRALVRVHRTEVRRLVAVVVLDQPPLDLCQTALTIGECPLSISTTHQCDAMSWPVGTKHSGTKRCNMS